MRCCEGLGKLSLSRFCVTISSLLNGEFFIAELMRVKRASGAPWVRVFGKSFHVRNFGNDVTYVGKTPDCHNCVVVFNSSEAT